MLGGTLDGPHLRQEPGEGQNAPPPPQKQKKKYVYVFFFFKDTLFFLYMPVAYLTL